VAPRSQDSSLRPRAVAKLMFMHMLGYPTHFGQMECLKLLSSVSYAEKARTRAHARVARAWRGAARLRTTPRRHAVTPPQRTTPARGQRATDAPAAWPPLSSACLCFSVASCPDPCPRALSPLLFPPAQRMGYLGLTLLLDERAEVLMLVTNSIQNDLKHKNQFVVALALCALGAVASPEMARDLAPDVERLFKSDNAYVRKKAPLCAVRVIRKVPELAEGFFAAAPALLRDRHHGVLLAGVTFARELCRVSPDAIPLLRHEVDTLVKVLKSLAAAAPASEHDVGGVNDPFLQVGALRLLRTLGAGDADASDAMSDILASVATNTDTSKNAGNAILYECVLTIMGIESIGSLRVLAINILGRFLGTRDNNSRYVALNTLSKVVLLDTGAVQRHRATIVECVKDADVSIRRRALDLVYGLVNETNITLLARELVEYLRVADVEFKPDLTARICGLAARFAPDKRWHIDTLVDVFAKAGTYAKEEAVRGAVVLIANAPELHGYAARALFRALSEERAQPALTQLAVWCIGEYGDALCAPSPALLDGEETLSVREADVTALLESFLRDHHTSELIKAYVITALAKLSTRLSPAMEARLRQLVGTYSTSISLELQQRAVEFGALIAHTDVRPAALEHMPAPDEAAWKARHAVDAAGVPHLRDVHASSGGDGAEGGAVGAGGAADEAAAPPAALMDLLGGFDDAPAAASSAASALADLLGGPSDAPPPAAAAAHNVDMLSDLLGGGGGASAPPARAELSGFGGADPMASLLAPAAAAAPVAAAPPAGPPGVLGPPIAMFSREGVTVAFQASKPPGEPASTTLVTGFYSNASAAPVTDFLLQAAVPKFMTLSMGPASGASMPPGNAGAPLTQAISVSNSQYGVKPLVMRLKISYVHGGAPVNEECTVNAFPPGA
jgi:AP-1 complex subunit gamma-1